MTREVPEIPDFLDRRKKQEQPHSDRAHATLAPSAAHRWINCPGSVRESKGIEETSSSFANEGTAAHELASLCLKQGFDTERFADYVIDITKETPGEMFTETMVDVNGMTRFQVDEEMVHGVQEYVDHVRDLVNAAKGEVKLDVEQRLDMTHIHPDIWGTGDATVYDEQADHLHVIDLKYGKGVAVDVEENWQLITYGAGAAKRYHNRGLKGITLWVVQPRAAHKSGKTIRDWEMHPLDLMDFEAELSEAAKKTEDPDAELKPGDWCKFCPAGPTCEVRRAAAKQAAMLEFDDQSSVLPVVEKMSPGMLADVLADAEFIGAWVKSVQEYAHDQAMAGKGPPGWKLVPKRAIRRWKDPDEAKFALELEGLEHDQIYAEPKLKSAPAIEKLMGKKPFKAAFGDEKTGEFIVKRSSGLNLVPDSDPRPAAKADGLKEFAP